MKLLIRCFVLFIMMIVLSQIHSSLFQKGIQGNELEVIVEDAMQQTQKVLLDGRYAINSNEEYIAEFYQNLVRESSAIEDIKLNVYGIDYTKGLLDIEVSTTIHYPNGKQEDLSSRKTSIIEKVKNEEVIK